MITLIYIVTFIVGILLGYRVDRDLIYVRVD